MIATEREDCWKFEASLGYLVMLVSTAPPQKDAFFIVNHSLDKNSVKGVLLFVNISPPILMSKIKILTAGYSAVNHKLVLLTSQVYLVCLGRAYLRTLASDVRTRVHVPIDQY